MLIAIDGKLQMLKMDPIILVKKTGKMRLKRCLKYPKTISIPAEWNCDLKIEIAKK